MDYFKHSLHNTEYIRSSGGHKYAAQSEKVSSNMRNRRRFRFMPRMRKASYGYLPSIDTFCKVA